MSKVNNVIAPIAATTETTKVVDAMKRSDRGLRLVAKTLRTHIADANLGALARIVADYTSARSTGEEEVKRLRANLNNLSKWGREEGHIPADKGLTIKKGALAWKAHKESAPAKKSLEDAVKILRELADGGDATARLMLDALAATA